MPMPNGTYRYPNMDRVIYGQPFAAALAAERARLGATHVFLMASGTLARETALVADAQAALDEAAAAQAAAAKETAAGLAAEASANPAR